VHPKGVDSMAVSGLHFENTQVGSEWATAIFLCTNGLRKHSSCPARRPFPVGVSGCRLSTVSIATSLMGGCGLSHECVEDGCKLVWSLGAENMTELGIW